MEFLFLLLVVYIPVDFRNHLRVAKLFDLSKDCNGFPGRPRASRGCTLDKQSFPPLPSCLEVVPSPILLPYPRTRLQNLSFGRGKEVWCRGNCTQKRRGPVADIQSRWWFCPFLRFLVELDGFVTTENLSSACFYVTKVPKKEVSEKSEFCCCCCCLSLFRHRRCPQNGGEQM